MSARGKAVVTIDGEDYPLVLTLGAMDEIETALDVESVNAALEMIKQGKSKPLIVVLNALIRGGKNTYDAASMTLEEAGDALACWLAVQGNQQAEEAGEADGDGAAKN